MTDICSAWAYDEIKKSGWLGERLSMYLSIFSDGNEGGLTARQATNAVRDRFGKGFECSSYVARCSDLEDVGFLKKKDTVRCEFTNKRVNRWVYTGRTRPLSVREEERTCPNCKGRGIIHKKVYYEEKSQQEMFT